MRRAWMRASRRALRKVRRMSVLCDGMYLNRGSRIDRVTGLLMLTSEWCWDEWRRLALDKRGGVNPSGEGVGCLRHQNSVAFAAQDGDRDSVEHHSIDSKMLHRAMTQKMLKHRRSVASLMSCVAVMVWVLGLGLGSVLRGVIPAQR